MVAKMKVRESCDLQSSVILCFLMCRKHHGIYSDDQIKEDCNSYIIRKPP
jgi:hypothetical protein